MIANGLTKSAVLRRRRATAVVLLCLASCSDETGVPHPDPIPDPARIRLTGLPELATTGKVDVVGLKGSVAGAGTVTLESAVTRVEAASTKEGSFAADIEAKPDEMLRIRYEESDPVEKRVIKQGISVPRPPEPIAGVPPITSLGGGKVRVEGKSHAGANQLVIGANFTTGHIGTSTTATDGSFRLELEASTGDSLQIHDDDDPLGPAWSLTVP
jgi:hypothetical protein